jgi:hypothetical protein
MRYAVGVAIPVSVPATADPFVRPRVDVGAGAAFGILGLGTTLYLRPEIGYSYRAQPAATLDGHLFTAGLGLGVSPWLWEHEESRRAYGILYLMPSLVTGSYGGAPASGLRTALRLEWLFGVLGLELAHQYIERQGRPFHEVQLALALDPLAAVVLVGGILSRAHW